MTNRQQKVPVGTAPARPTGRGSAPTRKTAKQYAAQRKVRPHGAPRLLPLDQQLLIDYEDLAAQAKLPLGTVRGLVRNGKGPRVILIGKHHRFAPKDVAAWIECLRDAAEVSQ